MNPTPPREETLFQAAVALSGPERAAFLDRECAGDNALRARLEALLAAHEQAEGALASHDDGDTRPTITLELPDLPDPAVGQTIGRYKLLEKLGEGGCGIVYVAEQTEPVRRRVALKVIKLGMDTREVIARFEAERQALAMMDHPNIARVLDAGTTESPHPPPLSHPMGEGGRRPGEGSAWISAGRPFFVMELVRGIRITDYCEQNKLSIKERLDLFIKVCQAIQHAHQKGIIHRDLKPSNILVTLHDGVPVPKVIDFGIAKATQGKLTDATVYTQLHQFIGTPAYMSPEQAEMSGLDIDTRSDIYSLGVLLYELLTGVTPFDAKELIASGIDAMRKTIRDQEPMRPSTRLRQSTLAASPSNSSPAEALPQSQFANRKSQIDSDLDWIVMKCLEKDRSRRYETANGLAADLGRHLNNEPVVARPPSAAYRVQKAFRRNKLIFAAGTAVGIALLAGLGVSTWQWARARQAEQAQRTQANEARAARDTATQAEKRALANLREARRAAYLADMRLVDESVRTGNIGRARRILTEHRAGPGQEDLRDWEWFFFERLAQKDESRLLGSHPGGAHALLAAPDGTFFTARRRYVPFGEFTGPLVSWNGTGQTPGIDPIDLNHVTAMALSQDGQLLAIARGLDIEIRSRANLAVVQRTLTNWHRPTRQPGPVHSLCFIDRDTRLAVSDLNLVSRTAQNMNAPSMMLVDVETDTATEPDWSAPLSRILSFTRSTRGDSLAVLGSRAVVLLSLPEGAEVRRFSRDYYEPPSRGIMQVLFVDEDRKLVTTSDAGAMDLWDVDSGRHLRTIGTHDSSVAALAVSTDGRLLASAGLDHQVKIWDLQAEAGQMPRVLRGHENEVWGLAFLPDGQSLVSCGRSEESVRLWNVRRPMMDDSRWPLPAYAMGALLTQGALVAALEGGRSFDVSNLGTMNVPKPIVTPPSVGGSLWIPLPGATHAMAVPFPLVEMVPGQGVPGFLYRLGDRPEMLSNFPNPGLSWQGNVHVVGDTLFVQGQLGADPYLLVYSLPEERLLLQAKSKLQGEITMAVSPGGRIVVLGDIRGRLEVWDIIAGTSRVHEQRALTSIVTLVVLPDQRSALAAGQPGILCRLDLSTGQVVDEVDASMLGIMSMALSPNASRLATGDAQGKVTLWDVESLREVAVLGHHAGLIFSVRFLPDGDTLLSVDNRELRIWRAPQHAVTQGNPNSPHL